MVQMALGTGKTPPGLAFAGGTASGWIADLLAQLEGHAGFEALAAPPSFHGTLRPYQERGYSWLAFLRRWRLGACLADDMGLGKTIQTLALIQREWEAEGHAPVLLVCPTSVVGNWQKEAARFTPNLIPGRSGKLARLTEMLEEILAVGERALVFSQFSEMGMILRRHLQEVFGREVLFLHGAVPKRQRDRIVERFQTESDASSIFLLSLKAGGTGLNLTGANHVFHFDRWWNPAVENQATDRAFRIGQMRDVQVHKFLCLGTLEERIDEMIERKQEVAAGVVGTGEAWLTELSTAELKELFTLRQEAVGE